MPDTRKYIDFTGLSYYDSKLKTWVTDLVNSHTPSVDAIQSIKAGQTELPVEEGTVTLSSVAGTGSYDDLKDKPFGETGSEFPLVSVHLADGEGHEGEIENDDITNAVITVTPSDSLVYSDPASEWPETDFDHIIWDDGPDTTAEGRFSSMYFYGPTLDMSGYVSTLKEFKSQKLEVTYNGTSYSLPLISEYDGVPEYESDETSFFAGQHQYQSSEYVFEYPFRVEIIIGTIYNEETGEDNLDFSHVFFTTYILCNHPFDISIGFSNKQIIKLDNKYLNIAQSITDGETGLATGDQVYDYVQANKSNAGDKYEFKDIKLEYEVSSYSPITYAYNHYRVDGVLYKNGQPAGGETVYMEAKEWSPAGVYTVNSEFTTFTAETGAPRGYEAGYFYTFLSDGAPKIRTHIIFSFYDPNDHTKLLCAHTFVKPAFDINATDKGYATADKVYEYVQSVAAQSISDGEAGYTTGDQVYDATLVKTSRETQLSPNEIVDFVEIKPTSAYSSSVITDYTEE